MSRLLTGFLLAASLAGCGRSSKAPAPKATATATASADDDAPPTPFVQKGVTAGKIVCGYVRDNKDPSKCAALIDVPQQKEVFERAYKDVEKLYRGKVVPSCPTNHVVGQCDYGNGLVVNYSGPKWTADTAKADCAGRPGRTWLE